MRPMCPNQRTLFQADRLAGRCHFRTKCIAAKKSYSITSSARSGNVGGMFNPITLALLRLITNSYLVGA